MFGNNILESLFHVIFEITGITFLVIFVFNMIRKSLKTTTKKAASPIAGAALGISPGCAGAISASTIYANGHAKFGFLAAALIATMGDGAFVLMARKPKDFFIIITVSFIAATIVGFIVNKLDIIIPNDKTSKTKKIPIKAKYKKSHIFNIFNNFVWRVFLFTIPFIAFMSIGHTFNLIPHSWVHSTWFESIVFITLTLMIINSVVINKLRSCKNSCMLSCETEHGIWFVFKKTFDQLSHIMTIIIIALIPVKMISANVDLTGIFTSKLNIFTTIIIASAISAFPGSAPQILILSLYLNGTMPFVGLLASAISSSGDATFILFANRKKALVISAIINFLVAVIVASIYYLIVAK